MNEKLKTIMDIIIEAYNNTEHCITNDYFYSFTVCYCENRNDYVDAGIDDNMKKYIKEKISPDICNQYVWKEHDTRTLVFVK